jgi:hypothetical protein
LRASAKLSVPEMTRRLNRAAFRRHKILCAAL